MPHSPLSRYTILVDQCEILPDAGQKALVMELQRLHSVVTEEGFFRQGKGFLSSLRKRETPRERPSGLYLWGGVGRGKSMLMDLFFDSLPFREKLRIHFHAFMLRVHGRIHELRREGDRLDPLGIVAAELAQHYKVLCFDEFQVQDVADAMILSRLFSELLDKGTVVVITSNRPPKDLYLHGLQREHFLPFIDMLHKRLKVLELASPTDFRTRNLSALAEVWHCPLGSDADRFIEAAFDQLTQHARPQAQEIEIKKRRLLIPRAWGDVCWFTFDELCSAALGAEDYLELAQLFRIFLIADIPQMTPDKRNESKRFITLIDVLYEKRAILIASAEAAPDALYVSGDGSFEFSRTASRLNEMRTMEYLARAVGSPGASEKEIQASQRENNPL